MYDPQDLIHLSKYIIPFYIVFYKTRFIIFPYISLPFLYFIELLLLIFYLSIPLLLLFFFIGIVKSSSFFNWNCSCNSFEAYFIDSGLFLIAISTISGLFLYLSSNRTRLFPFFRTSSITSLFSLNSLSKNK